MLKCFECGANAEEDWIACPKCGITLEHTAPLHGLLLEDKKLKPKIDDQEFGTWVQHGGLWLSLSLVAFLFDWLPDDQITFSPWVLGAGLITFSIHTILLWQQRRR